MDLKSELYIHGPWGKRLVCVWRIG